MTRATAATALICLIWCGWFFLAGWQLAKHRYECHQVGSGVFRTDRAVYRVCR